MRHNRPVKTAMDLRQVIDFTRHLSNKFVGVSLLSLCLASPVMAQEANESVYVDVSDPNITIDLSVLDDNGRSAPPLGVHTNSATPTRARSAQNLLRQPVNEGLPVSMLYIQPSHSLSLPPQTKPLITVQTAPDQSIVEDAPLTPVTQAREKAVVEHVAPPAPRPAPMPAPVAQAPVVEAKPAPKVVAVEPPVQQAPVKVAAPAPTPAPAPAVVDAAPEVKVETTPVAPPQPPMALSQPQHPQAETPPVAAAAPTADSAATSSTVVVDLPLKETPQPGVASLPPSTGPLSDGDNMRIVFDQDSSKLPQDARDALKALSDQLKGQESLRLQLLAYAGNADMSASAARRLSLSRALAVRSHLIESGVRSTRIDVRALGNKSSDEVTERVDITVVER